MVSWQAAIRLEWMRFSFTKLSLYAVPPVADYHSGTASVVCKISFGSRHRNSGGKGCELHKKKSYIEDE